MDPSANHPLGDRGQVLSASEIIDLERAQIGHDIHDTLLPLIFAAAANLHPIIDGRCPPGDDDGNQKVIDKVRQSHQWLSEALGIGRNLLTQIYPAELEKVPWLVAAKDAARRIAGQDCDVTWDVQADSPVVDSRWDRDHAAAAYRILIESIRNAVRHGEATRITVRCIKDQMSVQDNGKGFDVLSVDSNRFGIRSMKGRALLVGMNVTLQSQPGGPTTLVLQMTQPTSDERSTGF